MCNPFSSPKPAPAPVVQAPPIPPTIGDEQVRTATNTIRKRGSANKGFRYSILTSSQGDTSELNLGRTTLGGA